MGRMQYTPTLTDQKFDSIPSIESPARYMLGRMQYAPTLTDQKLDSLLSIESPARYVSVKYVFVESFSRQEFDHTCRGVLHTPHKRPRQGTNESICHPFFEYT